MRFIPYHPDLKPLQVEDTVVQVGFTFVHEGVDLAQWTLNDRGFIQEIGLAYPSTFEELSLDTWRPDLRNSHLMLLVRRMKELTGLEAKFQHKGAKITIQIDVAGRVVKYDSEWKDPLQNAKYLSAVITAWKLYISLQDIPTDAD